MLMLSKLPLYLLLLRSAHSISTAVIPKDIQEDQEYSADTVTQSHILERYEKDEGNIEIGVAVIPEMGTNSWPWNRDVKTCAATEPNSKKWLIVGKCATYEDAGVSLAGAAWTLGSSIYDWQSRKLCGPFSKEVPIGNGINFAIKYSATGRNCDTTTSRDHLIRALEDYIRNELHELLCGAICIKISHGGTWNGYALFGSSKDLVFTSQCDESIVDWQYCRSNKK